MICTSCSQWVRFANDLDSHHVACPDHPLKKECDSYRKDAVALWNMLDDIDTASDIAKDNEPFYRNLVEAIQVKRFKVFASDGFDLFKNSGNGSSINITNRPEPKRGE